jgi:hypothetical protein
VFLCKGEEVCGLHARYFGPTYPCVKAAIALLRWAEGHRISGAFGN